jgi:hypothetical protein
MPNTHSYTPDQVSVLVNGEEITNFNSVTITPQEDRVTATASATGDVTLVDNLNRIDDIEINMDQTSPGNAIMDAAKLLTDVFAFMLKDNSGLSIYVYPKVKISKEPTITFSEASEERVWGLVGAATIRTTGGN